jgi:hypothetical protein
MLPYSTGVAEKRILCRSEAIYDENALYSAGVCGEIYLAAELYEVNFFLFIFMARQPPVGQGLLIIEASRSHSGTPQHSVGLLWTSDRSIAETYTWQHSQETDLLAPCGIRTRNPRK